MKRLSVLFIAMAIMVGGCAMYQTKRDFMPDNTFVCNMPSLIIKLSPYFIYIGVYDKKLNTKDKGVDADLGRTSSSVHEYFVWQNKNKSKLICIQLSTLKNPQWRYIHKGYDSYTTVILGGDKWYTKKLNKWKFNDAHYKKLLAIDSTIEKEYAAGAQLYSRIGINSNMMVKVFYVSKTTENFTPDTDITMIWSSKNGHPVKRLLPKKNYSQKHLGFCIPKMNGDGDCYKTFRYT